MNQLVQPYVQTDQRCSMEANVSAIQHISQAGSPSLEPADRMYNSLKGL